MKKLNRNFLASLSGLIVAVSTAWLTIDWTSFNIKKEWPKLILTAAIAIGGFISSFNKRKD